MKKIVLLVLASMMVGGLVARPHGGHRPPPPPRHHSHHRGGIHGRHAAGFATGVIGGAIVGGIVSEALRPRTVVVESQPVVVTPAPVVVTPAPVAVQQPVYQIQNVWVEGRYVDQIQANGSVVRVWQPGHYEQRQVQVGVQTVYQ